MPRARRSASASPGRGQSHLTKSGKKSKHEESEEEYDDTSPTRSTRSHTKIQNKVMPTRSRRTGSLESPENKRRARSDSKSPRAKKAKLQENNKKGKDTEKKKEGEEKDSPKGKKSPPARKNRAGDDSTQKKTENSDSESDSEVENSTTKQSSKSEEKTGDSEKKSASESIEVDGSDKESSDDDIVCLNEETVASPSNKQSTSVNVFNSRPSWENSENDVYKALEWSGMTRTRGSKREALDKMCVSVAMNMLNGGSDNYSDEDDIESVSDETHLDADSDVQEISDDDQDDDDEILVMQTKMHKVKEEYEAILKEKNERIQRLRNEIKFKDEQLEEMNSLATKNMELEAKISYLLIDRKNYEKELKEVERKTEEKKGQETEVKKVERKTKEKKDEGKELEVETKTKEKKEQEKGKNKAPKDEVMEVEIISESESPEKEPRKSTRSVDVVSGDEANEGKSKQKRKGRRKRGRRTKENEDDGEDIDTLFVSDDEDEDADKETKPKGKKDKKDEKKTDTNKTEQEAEEVQDDSDDDGSGNKGRHNIRKLMTNKKLKEETKAAAKAEKERMARLARIKEQHFVVNEVDKKTKQLICTKLVLEFKKGGKVPMVELHHKLVRKLKPHQVDAVQFLWDSVIESVDRLKSDEPASGCILAHCMGLGKTLSVIAFVHTLMTHKFLKFHTCLVVCPLNTVLNWQNEWTKWFDKKDRLKVHELASAKGNHERAQLLQKWKKDGGIMIMGYQIFRILATTTTRSKKRKETFETTLINSGPDIVVCDEGHILKNDASSISKCMNRINSKRRIVLTGTPLQNNLVEYHCMVNFVKENLLGTRKEFLNRFVNPITNGQHADSTTRDVKIMKRRAHVLHEMLAGCVQRRDYSALTKFLPPKHEYVLSVRLSPRQMDLYQKYLDEFRGGGAGGSAPVVTKGAGLFQDFHNLMKVWTHPWVLKMDEIRQEKKALLEYDSEDDLDSFIDDESEEEAESSSTSDEPENEDESGLEEDDNWKPSKGQTKQKKSRNNKKGEDSKKAKENGTNASEGASGREERQQRRARIVAGEVIKQWSSVSRPKEGDSDSDIVILKEKKREDAWWNDMVNEDDEKNMELSGKLLLMFEILRMAEGLGDKVLVFSQSILSLDLIEAFLSYRNEEAKKLKAKKGTFNKWEKDEDYVRMDGSTGVQSRRRLTTNFNDAHNKRLRLFLISTRAGGLGINLDSANRVIIFDASWNPSHDIQSIFRVYRFGQIKPVYVYRFLAQGTMEEKIYERQVAKETLSQRVIDEQQLDRHFTAADLQELYYFTPDRLDDPERKKKPTPKVPEDIILAEMLSGQQDWLVGYHEHDSLLERRPEQDLTEEERQAAWEDYERDKDAVSNLYTRHPLQQQPLGLNLDYVPGRLQHPMHPFQGMPGIPGVPQGNPYEPHAKINFQIAQLPRVVQEILKYNPTITSQELHSRLQSFLGMHTKYGNVPAIAVDGKAMVIKSIKMPKRPAAEGLAAVSMAATSMLNSMPPNTLPTYGGFHPSISGGYPSTSTVAAPQPIPDPTVSSHLPLLGRLPGSSAPP